MYRIYSQTQNVRVFRCPTCSNIHFEYKNLNFNFETIKDYKQTAKYFLKLDGELWETKNAESYFRRKIFIPIGHKNFHILLDNEELEELKRLFFYDVNIKSSIFKSSDLNSDFCEN